MVDVREDEEQNVKLSESIDLLLAAGYFRTRFKGLTPFDKDPESSSQHVKQFQYISWPSQGVPNTAVGLLDVREQVEKWQRNSGDKPIIVHCSGGCGRTGTYIAICLLIDRLKTEGLVDVFQTVRGLRLQRPGMVRSVDQYEFCYKSVLEYLGSFDTYANFSL